MTFDLDRFRVGYIVMVSEFAIDLWDEGEKRIKHCRPVKERETEGYIEQVKMCVSVVAKRQNNNV